ncbi:MAG: ABC transporter permease [Candidatus Atribacteria bacterium]|nr:ABC transporter permease [Candidatus Atribacteria bacterium]
MGKKIDLDLQKYWHLISKNGILFIFILLCVLLSIITPGFLSWANILNVLRQSSIIGIMAIGTTFVIIGGGFDISVGSILALTAAMCVGLQYHMHWIMAILLVLIIGALIGLLNGFLAVKIHIPPIIATLGTMTIVRGLTYLYTGGYPLYVEAPDFAFIGTGYLGPIPFPVVLLIIMVAFWQFIIARTRFGRYACAIGGNKEAARLSGVKVDYYHILVFIIGGLMASLAGVVYASRLLSVTPLAGQGYELDAIASAVIGGTSVSGGEGSVVRTLIGVLLLIIIANVFNLLGIHIYVQYVVKGAIILSAVGFDTYSKFRQ